MGSVPTKQANAEKTQEEEVEKNEAKAGEARAEETEAEQAGMGVWERIQQSRILCRLRQGRTKKKPWNY